MLPSGKRYLSGRIVDVQAVDSIASPAAALPSLIAIAKNAAGATRDVIRQGIKKVSDEERGRRLSICEGCEFIIRKNDAAHRCAKCGCFLNFKSRLDAWHCPIGKW